jgi:hypothetical protein
VNLRPRICYLLALLKIHSPNCEHCIARLTCGDEIRKRLEELNTQKQSCLQEDGNHRESRKAGELLKVGRYAQTPISLGSKSSSQRRSHQ